MTVAADPVVTFSGTGYAEDGSQLPATKTVDYNGSVTFKTAAGKAVTVDTPANGMLKMGATADCWTTWTLSNITGNLTVTIPA